MSSSEEGPDFRSETLLRNDRLLLQMSRAEDGTFGRFDLIV
jgi:hypothetical protein